MITPNIETKRLVLKRGIMEDYEKVYEYDFRKLKNINGEFEYVKQNPEELKEFYTQAEEDKNCIDFIIYIKGNMRPVGNLVYDRYIEENKSLEITCHLHPNYWKRGYMTEAIIESMKYIFNNYDIENIRYEYAEDNFRSKALKDKIGFKYTGYHTKYYSRINKDIKIEKSIMSKEDYKLKYHI